MAAIPRMPAAGAAEEMSGGGDGARNIIENQ